MKPKGLGRGLDALLGGDEAPRDTMLRLPVARIHPGRYQPRTRMDEQALAELAASIRAQGLMQPLLVRPIDRGDYELIAGERRWRAAQLAGLDEVPALVREVPDAAALAMSLIENIQRENLNPMEESAGLQRLIDEFKMTHEQAADAVGRSRSATTNLLRLLKGGARRRKARADRDLARLEDEVSARLGTTVEIRAGRRGTGKVLLHYSSLEHLETLLKKLR